VKIIIGFIAWALQQDGQETRDIGVLALARMMQEGEETESG
jgi:hypothetical protein